MCGLAASGDGYGQIGLGLVAPLMMVSVMFGAAKRPPARPPACRPPPPLPPTLSWSAWSQLGVSCSEFPDCFPEKLSGRERAVCPHAVLLLALPGLDKEGAEKYKTNERYQKWLVTTPSLFFSV